MAVEKLSIELEAKVGKYKSDLLEAQQALLQLEKEALKAGGASEAMAAKIAKAKLAVKASRNEYQLAAVNLRKYAMEARKATVATGKLGKSQKQSRQAYTQIAYAIDDMQYGFQGVQNNIQALAVSMGLSGPLIAGITVTVVAIGMLVKKFEKARRAAKEAEKALSEKQGLVSEMLIYAEVVKDTTKGTKAHEDALIELKKNGYDSAKQSLDQYIDKLKEQMIIEAQLEGQQAKLKDLLRDRNKAADDIKDIEKISGSAFAFDEESGKVTNSGFLSAYNRRRYEKLKATIKELDSQIKETVNVAVDLKKTILEKDVKGKSPMEKKLRQAREEAEKLEDVINSIINKGGFKDLDVEEMEALEKLFPHDKFNDPYDFTEGKDVAFIDEDALDMQEEIDAYLNDLNKMIEHTEYMRTTVGGAFADLGNIIATNLGRNGDAMSAFLGAAIGTYTKLLATNKAFLAKLIPLKKTEAAVNATASATETASKIPFGAFVLPALIAGALAAVSSAFSSAGAGGVSSSAGGGGGKSNSMTVARPNPVRESKNSRIRGNELIIPMNDVYYGQQIASDNRSGLN